MSIFKRGLLYIRGKKARCLIMLLIVSLVSTMLIAAFSIRKTGEVTQQTVRKSIQSVMVTPKANTLPEDSHGEGSLRKTEVDKVRQSNAVKGINASQMGITQAEGLKVLEPPKTYDFDEPTTTEPPYLTLMGNTNTQYDARFVSGMLSLVQGKHITEDSQKEVLVHEKFAKLNNLKVGDVVRFSKDPIHYKGNDFSKVEARIVGIFKGETVSQAVYPEEMVENSFLGDESLLKEVYGYSDAEVKYYSVNFYLENSADIDKFVEQLKATNIDFSYFDILKKDPSLDTYNRSLKILNNTINALYIGIIIVSSIVLVLAMLFWIRSKTKDTGILLALGKTKLNIIMGYLFEIFIIVALSLSLSFLAGNKVGNALGNGLINAASNEARQEVRSELSGGQLGADAYTDMTLQTVKNVDVDITPEEYEKFYLIITGLILTSTAISTVTIVRLKPREILTKLS